MPPKPVPSRSARGQHLLSHPQRDMLWTVAQHKYGWTYVSRSRGQLQVAQALERRGLVELDMSGSDPVAKATQAGRQEIEQRWPVSPFELGTYAHQPEGWDPKEGRDAA